MRVIATAGHVDHGKSTLVQALTGIDPDRFEEEKRRGLTIDLGFAWTTLPSGLEIGIVDVPGHERFIRNMLAGVGAVDAVLFVVAADEGWMPQSAEHLQIVDFLGVTRGVIALTKTDVAGELADEAETDVQNHIAGSALEHAPIVRVSATTGEGLDELRTMLDDTLTDLPAPNDKRRVRMWIDRSFTIKGAGTVVTGTLAGGPLTVGQEIHIVPGDSRARIRSMQTHGRDVEEAAGPRRLALNLVGLDRRLVHRGDALVTDDWIPTTRFAVKLSRDDFKERGAYELFAGSAQTMCRVRFLGSGFAEVFTDRALPVVSGDRFVIRDVGRWETIAGGIVIDEAPSKLRRGDTSTLEAREGLSDEALDTYLTEQKQRERAVLAERAERSIEAFHASNPLEAGITLSRLASSLDVDAPTAEELVAHLQAADRIVVERNLIRLAGREGVALSAEDRNAANRALNLLRDADASPPDLEDAGLTQGLARALERAGELVFLTPRIAYPADVWSEIEKRVVGFITDNGSATVSQIRDVIGTTRKYAVPLLEKLDAIGITRRSGDTRQLGPRGRELADS